MNPLLLGPVLNFGGKLIERLFPDPAAKAAAELELLKLTQAGELQTVLAQLEINAREAAHPSIFVSGGRPLFLWIAGAAFAYSTIVHPVLTWFARIKGWPDPPEVNTELLWVVVTGLLGIGGYRSFEKARGVASR